MKAVLKNKNLSWLWQIGMAACVLLTWGLLDHFSTSLDSDEHVPIKRVKKVQEAASTFDVQKLYPVKVERAGQAAKVETNSAIDDVFRADPPPKPVEQVEPPEPDYSALLQQLMKVEGVGTNGAFINGRFYSVGEKVPEYSYPMRGKEIIPVLSAVNGNTVLVKHGTKTAVFKL